MSVDVVLESRADNAAVDDLFAGSHRLTMDDVRTALAYGQRGECMT